MNPDPGEPRNPDGLQGPKPGAGQRVLVGLSGGVDSAVAAMLLKERGFQVTGVRMRVYDGPDNGVLAYGCYGRGAAEDQASAEGLARQLNIPLAVIDCAPVWRDLVLEYFRGEYLAGRTPNPCVRCNQLVKFLALPRLAEESGLKFDFFATGHYARVDYSVGPDRPALRRGADQAKDQSYFLYRLSPECLARTIFPLGDLTKAQVRRLAAERGLAVHDRPDSQDFYGGDYTDLLDLPDREGAVVDSRGRLLGRHRGFWRFTPGQRKGLGACGPAPHYVLRVNPERNEVVAGTADENSYQGCLIGDTVFHQPEPAPGTLFLARTRSSQPLREVVFIGRDERGRMKIKFAKPMSGLAPGQSLVLYHNDLVVGGGIIEKDDIA